MKVFVAFALIAVLLAPPLTAGGEVQVIANPSLGFDQLTADEIKDVFLAVKTSLHGATVEPVFQQGGEAHQAFLRTYLGKSDAALRSYFRTLVFTGKGAQPKAFATDAEVAKYVLANKGAIGYVSGAAETAGAKKMQIK